MTPRDKYCCFLHPQMDYDPKRLTDCCPECGRTYGFPLTNPPVKVGDYEILAPIARGFYGAIYKAARGRRFQNIYAVKVIPQIAYEFFKKNFEEECQTHRDLSENTEHLAKIDDYFDEEVTFGDITLRCHIAVLEWVDGETLEAHLSSGKAMPATEIAQVALDLISLLTELRRRGRFHNDLHSRNVIIERNADAPIRADRLDSKLRAIAVDFGSISDASQSSDSRLGDLASVGEHLLRLVQQIVKAPSTEDSLNWHLAFSLQEIARSFSLDPKTQRHNFDDIKEQIFTISRYRALTPIWKTPFVLTDFSSHYNARTIHSAHVPHLFVLPEKSQWLEHIKSPGPQLISGMRGCGKTMLLKCLDFHSRAFPDSDQPPNEIIKKIQTDGFVGLFVACSKLLESNITSSSGLYNRLFLAYCLEAVRIAQHLEDIDVRAVNPQFVPEFIETLHTYFEDTSRLTEIRSLPALENFLVRAQVTAPEKSTCRLDAPPSTVFPLLSDLIRRISPGIFSQLHVLFLLDDVSTRNVSDNVIAELVSTLLFSNEKCSFKFTTEAQTLELTLRSTGNIELAREGRDYTVFDLGREVGRLIRAKESGGKAFISEILNKRQQFYPNRPELSPDKVLGDQRLSNIAEAIARKSTNDVYWGLSALTNVCVGDIGDVIRLYHDILREAQGEYPVKPAVQHRCFQRLCTTSVYDVNRKDSKFKHHAVGFGKASHKLLCKSFRNSRKGTKRIRQYAQVYVNLSSKCPDWVFGEIRRLIDAGVYALDTSSASPRRKNQGGDPILQFVLTFRKLYGLSYLIPLSYRDRFELHEEALIKWLQNPEESEKILLENQGSMGEDSTDGEPAGTSSSPIEVPEEQSRKANGISQIELPFTLTANTGEAPRFANEGAMDAGVQMDTIPLAALPKIGCFIAGLGFEERSVASVERILNQSKIEEAILLRYPEPGRTTEIVRLMEDFKIPFRIIDYDKVDGCVGDKTGIGPTLIDVSGLAKPAIFFTCRDAIERAGEMYVAHTGAQEHFPSQEEIAAVLERRENDELTDLLERVATLFRGEEGGYNCIPLLKSAEDPSRPRALLTFSSAKHERLLSLLDQRVYDFVAVAYSSSNRPRGRIGELAAEFAVRNAANAVCKPVSSNDLKENFQFFWGLYRKLAYQSGCDVEVGLTGSKVGAIAVGILAAKRRLSQAWYVHPGRFVTEKFTLGVSDTKIYKITSSGFPLEEDRLLSAN